MTQTLKVSCGIAGFVYNPTIKETADTYVLLGGLTDEKGHPVFVGNFIIPKDVARVELRLDDVDFYLVNVRGWLSSTNGELSPEIRVAQK